MMITASLFPAILESKKQDEELYKRRMQRLYTFMFWLAFAITLPMSLLSDRLVVIIFGAPYQAAGQILMVQVWASIFVFWGVASSKWFLVEKLQVLALINTAFGAAVNLLLNYKLIPVFGMVGAAYATLISYAVAGYFMNFIFAKSRENFYMLSSSVLQIRNPK
jgi:O-antigen/teichoic acid export membrane protein